MSRLSLRMLPLWSALLLIMIGCNAPRETIPSINTSSGTTDEDLIDQSGDADKTAGNASGTTVEVSLIDFDGLQAEVQKHSGKIVVVDIWSNSCLPCMEEFHNLVELSKKYPERLACISMNVDFIGLKSKPPESSLPRVREFLAKEEATSVINFASSEPDSDVLQKYEVDSMPAVIIYNAEGELVARFTDSNSGENGLTYSGVVFPKIDELLAAKASN